MLIIIYRAYVLINEDEFTVYIRMLSVVPTLTLTQLPFTYFSTYVFAVIFVTVLLPVQFSLIVAFPELSILKFTMGEVALTYWSLCGKNRYRQRHQNDKAQQHTNNSFHRYPSFLCFLYLCLLRQGKAVKWDKNLRLLFKFVKH